MATLIVKTSSSRYKRDSNSSFSSMEQPARHEEERLLEWQWFKSVYKHANNNIHTKRTNALYRSLSTSTMACPCRSTTPPSCNPRLWHRQLAPHCPRRFRRVRSETLPPTPASRTKTRVLFPSPLRIRFRCFRPPKPAEPIPRRILLGPRRLASRRIRAPRRRRPSSGPRRPGSWLLDPLLRCCCCCCCCCRRPRPRCPFPCDPGDTFRKS
mmetsp:Transcript_26760/g.58902  ORF Transcript_26760/g.58902 Transcript_26760/m.58902 type:complete len:211 (-) Transcript_26760:64-696(-)